LSVKKPKGNPSPEEFPYTPTEAVDKMITAITTRTGAWNEGVQRTKLDVMAIAASDAAEDNFAAAMAKVIAEKLRAAGLKEVSTAEWKRIIAEKSAAWAAGVRAKEAKIRRKVAAAIDVTYEAATAARALPKGLPGSDENKARMIKYFEERVRLKAERGT